MIQLVRDLSGSKTFKLMLMAIAGAVEERLRGAITTHQAVVAVLAAVTGMTLRHAIAKGGRVGGLAALAAEVAARVRAGDDPEHDQALEILEKGFLEVAKKSYSDATGKEPPIK